jgi:hypothetical protein
VNQVGKGRVIVAAAADWMSDALTYRTPEIVDLEPPYRLLNGLRTALDAYFGSFSPVSVDPPGLTVRTCHFDDDPKRLLVGLINNDLFADWHGALRLRRAKAVSARELWRQQKLRPGQTIPLEVHAGDAAIIELRLPTPQP